MEKEILGRFANILKRMGYPEVQYETSPEGFQIHADLWGENESQAIALFVRRGLDIPELLIQKIGLSKSSIPEVSVYVVFLKRPRTSIVRRISLYGIGVALLKEDRLSILSRSRNFSDMAPEREKIAKDAAAEISKMNVFPSSAQKAPERRIIVTIIDEIRDTFQVPVFPLLVEKDSTHSMKDVKKNILEFLEQTDIFVGVLGKSFRPLVDFEVRRSFDYLSRDRIVIIVKEVSSDIRDSKQNKLVKWLKDQDYKYIPYYDLPDCELTARREIYRKVKSIYEDNGVKCPF